MDNAGLRNLKDFLLQYNKITESCFLNCVNHLGERNLSQDESKCVDMCTKKFINVNHKIMQVYLEIQPLLINKRIEEMNKQQTAVEESQKKEIEGSKPVEIPFPGKPKVEKLIEPKGLINSTPGNVTDKEIIRTQYQ